MQRQEQATKLLWWRGGKKKASFQKQIKHSPPVHSNCLSVYAMQTRITPVITNPERSLVQVDLAWPTVKRGRGSGRVYHLDQKAVNLEIRDVSRGIILSRGRSDVSGRTVDAREM